MTLNLKTSLFSIFWVFIKIWEIFLFSDSCFVDCQNIVLWFETVDNWNVEAGILIFIVGHEINVNERVAEGKSVALKIFYQKKGKSWYCWWFSGVDPILVRTAKHNLVNIRLEIETVDFESDAVRYSLDSYCAGWVLAVIWREVRRSGCITTVFHYWNLH